MAVVRPFRGWRYNRSRVPDLSRVITPPYDVISASRRQELQNLSSDNMVRLEFGLPLPSDGETDNVYVRAAHLLEGWRATGVLAREEAPAFYLVEEAFERERTKLVRLVLYGSVTLEPWDRGVILPHEETTPGPKQDRLRLLRACRANISPVMALYQDSDGLRAFLGEQARSQPPTVPPFRADGVSYRLWVLRTAAATARVSDALRDERLYIADGHHRYETALTYRDAAGPGQPGAAQVLAGLVSMDDPGLEVQSFHRVLSGMTPQRVAALRRRLAETFDLEPVSPSLAPRERAHRLLAMLNAAGVEAAVFGLLERDGRAHLLRLKAGVRLPPALAEEFLRCETWLLHRALLDPALGNDALRHLGFPHGLDEVLLELEQGRAQMALLVRPIPLGLFRKLVAQGQRLPPKTTYFYPKLPAGIVLRTLDEAP